ncbi:SDR family NAD(P)-dependent oxidoreductase [Kineosporia babensis]|uniref:SDR family oxidoreductase n=1 Tax=Kineosporia babensis TaxID=499548 RepID=A0A9X1NMF0_9ACTN|nr:SDR family oxidoreductase [Kineosporia babensis]MCD5316411.1 SDR family oxidoreductase [Kineosporia babensis]
MSEYAGVRAIVTGGASGIGRATALELQARGAKVAALDLKPGEDAGISQVSCDVSDQASVEDAVTKTAALLGGIDVVVNNAGIGARGTIEDTPDETFLALLNVNVLGAVRVTRAALPWLRQSRSPVVVNTGSIAAWTGLEQRAAYSTSKGALHALTLAMATDHVREGIRVNCVQPGTADTPWVQRLLDTAADPAAERAALDARQPLGRLVAADEVAHAICYLASPKAGSTTGAVLAVDGGSHTLRPIPQ